MMSVLIKKKSSEAKFILKKACYHLYKRKNLNDDDNKVIWHALSAKHCSKCLTCIWV